MPTITAVASISVLVLFIVVLCVVFAMTFVAFMHAVEHQVSALDEINEHLSSIRDNLSENLEDIKDIIKERGYDE